MSSLHFLTIFWRSRTDDAEAVLQAVRTVSFFLFSFFFFFSLLPLLVDLALDENLTIDEEIIGRDILSVP